METQLTSELPIYLKLYRIFFEDETEIKEQIHNLLQVGNKYYKKLFPIHCTFGFDTL